MEYIVFPNDVLTFGFYVGTSSILELIIHNSKFNRIVPECFHLCDNLEILRIIDGELDELINIGFNLQYLSEIHLYRVDVKKINFLYLEHHIYYLRSVEISNLPYDMDLQTTFHTSFTFPWLINYLTIGSNSPKFHVLAADNFSNLNNLESLDLSSCGIRVITIDAFVHIIHKLTQLTLIDNQLTYINFRMFYNAIDGMLSWNFYLNMIRNKLICTCEYVEIKSIVEWIWPTFSIVAEGIHVTCTNEVRNQTCSSLQKISLNNFCIDCPNITETFLQYPKFILKLNKDFNSVIINTDHGRYYRLWMRSWISLSDFNAKWGFPDKMCPKNGFLHMSVKCVLLSGSTVQIPLGNFHESANYMQICVSYVSGRTRKIWPLHCITRTKQHSNELLNVVRVSKYFLWFLTPILMGIVMAMITLRSGHDFIVRVINVHIPLYDQPSIRDWPVGDFNIFEDTESPQYESIQEYEYIGVGKQFVVDNIYTE